MSTSLRDISFLALCLAASWIGAVRQSVAQPAGGPEVLARGPVHEAFAEPLNLQGADPLAVEVSPPEPVEEMPPDDVPDGNNVQWMPGYWAWEDDRNDFIWISGVWRDCPPGQTWVPGYWSKGDRDWYWSAGFWVSETSEVVEYLPEPPQSLEAGPVVDAPSENHIWVPGVWRYVETRFVWRPGYWTVAQPDWMWAPAHYVWSPSGYVFVDGYWDYPLALRGVLFAPVYYQQPTYLQANYHYTPSTVISTDLLTVHLFARPRYGHYYFGDYYAPRYREIGIEPWLMLPRKRGGYDPLFSYYAWHNRRDGRDWDRIVRDRYDFFDQHRDYRPAHTFSELRQQRFDPIRTGDLSIQNIVSQQNNLVVNYKQHVENGQRNVQAGRGRFHGQRFAKLGDDDRRKYVEQAKAFRGFQQRRSDIENAERKDIASEGGAISDTDQRKGLNLPLTELRQTSALQHGRDRTRRGPVELPPTPERSVRRNPEPRPVTGDTGKSIAESNPDALQNAERGRPPSDRDGVLARPNAPDINARSNAYNEPVNGLGDRRADRGDRRPEFDAGNARDARIRQSESNPIGPRRTPPDQTTEQRQIPTQTKGSGQRDAEALRSETDDHTGNLRSQREPTRGSVDRFRGTNSPGDQRRTSNYPPASSGDSASEYRQPGSSKERSSQAQFPGSPRENTPPATGDSPRYRDRGAGVGDPDGNDRRFSAPKGPPTPNTRDLGPSATRRINGTSLPPATSQVAPKGGGQRVIQGSNQSTPRQLRNDDSGRGSRGQFGRGDSPALTSGDRSSKRALSTSPRTAQEAARAATPKGDTLQRSATQGKRDARTQPKNSDRDGDTRSKRRDKEKEDR